MEVKLSYEPWGYKNVDAVIDSVDVEYHYDEAHNCGVFYPVVVCYVGKYRITFNGPINWETLVIKQCRKLNVKDLKVGDVVERGNQIGFVKSIYDGEASIVWFNTIDKYCFITSFCKEIKDAEFVGHIDLWNL